MLAKITILSITLIGLILPFVYKLPIPADTIPGMYYPMRDIPFGYANGVPVKNPLITDPVRQQFVWKYLAIGEIKKGNVPLWNPYNMSGAPLLANIQSGVFYPLNLIFFLPNTFNYDNLQFFAITWSWFIYIQIPLSVFFLYLYLRKIGVSEQAALYAGSIWALSGFTASWWQWGNVVHTLLYFPLILWCVENIISQKENTENEKENRARELIKSCITINKYKLILITALSASFFAGHLQTFVLIVINTALYVLYKIPIVVIQRKKPYYKISKERLAYWLQLTQVTIIFLMIIAIQLIPAIEYIVKSARNIDKNAWQRKDWFYPKEHFISLIAPDYFGNPSTYNYWGVWNYGEFAAYTGIMPIMIALAVSVQFIMSKISKKNKAQDATSKEYETGKENTDANKQNNTVGVFLLAIIITIILITENALTKTIYAMHIPFVTTTQPSRGIAIVIFSLVVLNAIGFDQIINMMRKQMTKKSFLKIKKSYILSATALISIATVLWINILTRQKWLLGVLEKTPEYDVFKIAQRNMILPTLLGAITIIGLILYIKQIEKQYEEQKRINYKIIYAILGILVLGTVVDLGRFFIKFQSFSEPKYLYPPTEVTKKLQQDPTAKYMTDDSRIMPPNMNIAYKLKSVEGYDPLYFNQYGKLIGIWARNEPNLEPYKANRILTPHKPKSIIADVSAVKYLITLGEYPEYEKIAQEGKTKLYLRNTAIPRVTVVPIIRGFATEQDMVNYMFSKKFDPRNEALYIMRQAKNKTIPKTGIETRLGNTKNAVIIKKDEPTTLQIQANLADEPGLLYIADTYDDGWIAKVNGRKVPIIKTNLTFRGIMLDQGENDVILQYKPKLFEIGANITIFGIAVIIYLTIVSMQKRELDT